VAPRAADSGRGFGIGSIAAAVSHNSGRFVAAALPAADGVEAADAAAAREHEDAVAADAQRER
jgi:hypothetical protein